MAKHQLAPCPVCKRTPVLGRDAKTMPGRRGRHFVIFCEGSIPEHAIEMSGYPRGELIQCWNQSFSLTKGEQS